MANEKFKVKFGLAVGDTVATIDATTGNIITAGTLDVQGGTITDSTGALSITTGASNGNITLDPNGTGDIVLTLANGGNLTNDRNYVFGAIRNATTEGLGDIWALNASSTTTPTRGISIDNSADTTKTASYLARTYGATAATRSRLVFERARGTAASPTAVQSGDFLGEVNATGYSSTGWINDTVTVVPGFFGFTAAENWVSNTNLGTTFGLSLAPTATTISSGANLVSVISANPQTFACRSDSYTWSNGKTGTTQKMALDVNGNLTLSAVNKTTELGSSTLQVGDVNIMQAASTWQSALSPGFKYTGLMSDSTLTGTGSYFEMSSRWKATAASTTYTTPLTGWGLGRFGFSADNSTAGTNQVNAGAIQSKATEDWTSTATGSSLNFIANKAGAANVGVEVLNMSPENTYLNADTIVLSNQATTINFANIAAAATTFKSDAYTFQDSAGVDIVGSNIDYNRVYGQFQYDTTVTPVAADTAYVFPLGTADINNIATVGSTSRLIAGAAGIYNLQFSVQVDNADNSNDHDAYIWLRKNGTDVVGSMGRTTVTKNNAGSLKIIAWNYLVSSANVTDYWEIAYAVSDTDVTFPAFASTAFGPSTACIITSLTPVGA